jgi:uncharacterized coiled-coil protein SlyX
MSEDRLNRLEKIVESNAKSIEALTNSITEHKSEWEKDRRGIYQLLGRLTHSMSDFYETQSDFYRRFDQIDELQADIAQILRELKNSKDTNENR